MEARARVKPLSAPLVDGTPPTRALSGRVRESRVREGAEGRRSAVTTRCASISLVWLEGLTAMAQAEAAGCRLTRSARCTRLAVGWARPPNAREMGLRRRARRAHRAVGPSSRGVAGPPSRRAAESPSRRAAESPSRRAAESPGRRVAGPNGEPSKRGPPSRGLWRGARAVGRGVRPGSAFRDGFLRGPAPPSNDLPTLCGPAGRSQTQGGSESDHGSSADPRPCGGSARPAGSDVPDVSRETRRPTPPSPDCDPSRAECKR